MFDTFKNHSNDVVILRWLPDLFVDIPFEHTQELLENSGVPRQTIIDTSRSQASDWDGHIPEALGKEDHSHEKESLCDDQALSLPDGIESLNNEPGSDAGSIGDSLSGCYSPGPGLGAWADIPYETCYRPNFVPLPLLPISKPKTSLAAPWDSASVDSDAGLDEYLERHRKGIEGRGDFFTDAEDDESLQVVQELLLKWTTVDDSMISDNNAERLRLLSNYA